MAALAPIFDVTVLTLVTGALSILLVVMFAYRGLIRPYPVFFAYCVYDIVVTAAHYLPGKLETVNRIDIALWMLQWVFYFLLVLELMDRILLDHPGLARLGRRVFQGVMVVAAVAAVASLKLDRPSVASISQNLRLFFQVERVVAACLLFVLLLMNLFLWFFPVRVSRNTKVYCWGFTLLFLFKSLGPFVINHLGLSAADAAGSFHLTGVLLCQLMWLFAITKTGAERTPAFPRQWTNIEQQKVISTLNAFEQQISRTRSR